MPSKEFDRTLSGMVSTGLDKVKKIASVGIYTTCRECGNRKPMIGGGPCPHDGTEGNEETKVTINLVPGKPQSHSSSKVERVPRSESRQISSRYKDPTKADPLEHDPVEERVDDIWAEVRGKGGYRRKDTTPSDWGMSSKELARRQDRADGFDVEPEEPDVPTYPL